MENLINKEKNILIEIKNLFKYSDHKTILNDISLNIYKNDVIAIIGDNGAGKTTLIKTIVGMYPIDKGKINYNFNYKTHFSERMSLLFQEQNFINFFKVKDLINLFKNQINPKRIELIKELKEILRINEIFYLKMKVLSGGQKQKVGLFLTFLENSDIFLLDEFSNHIDPETKEKLKFFLKKMNKEHKITILIVTHDIHNEVVNLCNRIIWIHDSKIKKNIKIDTENTNYKMIKELLEI